MAAILFKKTAFLGFGSTRAYMHPFSSPANPAAPCWALSNKKMEVWYIGVEYNPKKESSASPA